MALAECAIWGGLGARLRLPVGGSPAAELFGESPSRLVLTARPRHAAALALLARQHSLPVETLGAVGGDRLVIELAGDGATGAAEGRGSRVADAVDVALDDLRHAWRTACRARSASSSRGHRLMCGVYGVVLPDGAAEEAAQLAALGLFALQHRGQESAGLAVSDGQQLMLYKDLGLISSVLDERRLPSLRGRLAIAHCRYSTTGSTVWENAQPTFRLGPRHALAIGHNGNLVNTRELLGRLRGGRARLPPAPTRSC